MADTLAPSHVRERAPAEPVTLPRPLSNMGEVASGGMGTVHRAWDHDLNRLVAVKRVHQRLMGDPSIVDRFVAEARINGQLDHPNIVPVHTLVRDAKGAHFLVMKLVEGRTLTRVLDDYTGPLTHAQLDDLMEIFHKVCDAISFAHSRGVVHRDLKPDNIMVGTFGQVYVMDWGLAKVLPRRDHNAQEEIPTVVRPAPPVGRARSGPIGTPWYMAPEQALELDDEIDERTDVFLLGAVLYQMLTGTAPYRGGTMMNVLYRAINADVVPPEVAAPDRHIPKGLSRIVLKAMHRDSAHRHQTVRALRDELERFLRGEERFPTVTFPAGARIITQGQQGDAAYLILSGRCLAFREVDGELMPLREMGPGEVFGELAIVSDRPTSASVEALEPITVKVVTRESLTENLGLDTWMGVVVRCLAERFRDASERVTELERELTRLHRGEAPSLIPPSGRR
ncbi:MAG: protein kinase [Polyangiales bacterium]